MSTTWSEQRTSHWFVTGWAEQFEAALGLKHAEDKPAPSLTPSEPHPEVWEAWKDPVWCSVKANIRDGAELFIGCARDTANELAVGVRGSNDAGIESVLEAHRNVIQQTLSALGPSIETRIRRPAGFGSAVEASQPPVGSLGVEYQINLGNVVHLLALVPSQDLIDAVLSATPAAGAGMASATPAKADEGSSSELPLSPPVSHNLKVLLDVDLDLSVSFGKTKLALEDVLKLASGSIVELNRSANDPVDVLVNNSVVARGEVVVIDGNYGIRVTEVVSRKERIRSVM